jgi:hypothetical protein
MIRLAVRPTIVWDLDDTLNDLMQRWLEWFLARSPALPRIHFSEVVENPPDQLLGISREEYLTSLDEFRASPEARAMLPSAKLLDWFELHGFEFHHHVLTARPRATVPAAAEWVFTHFGRWVRHFHFVPACREHDRLPDEGASKSDVIASLGGVDFFVDDARENLHLARGVARVCLLMPQPWNQGAASLEDLLAALTTTTFPAREAV